jgi:hypothetical protein
MYGPSAVKNFNQKILIQSQEGNNKIELADTGLNAANVPNIIISSSNAITNTVGSSTLIMLGASIDLINGTTGLRIEPDTVKITDLPEYADEAAAITGGLESDTLYRTSTGQLMIKL